MLGFVLRACLLLVVAAVPASGMASEPVRVIVTVLPQAEVASRVGGDLVVTVVLVPPGGLPDTFEVTPKQMATLADADIWLTVGVPFEGFLVDRIRSLAPGLTVVDGCAGIERQPMDGGDHPGHAHGAVDPHIWLDPALVARHADNLADALCRAAPAECQTFRANLASYRAELAAVDRRVAAILAKHRGAAVFVYHPAYGYLARRYGLDQVPVEVDGKVPTGRRLAALVDRAKTSGAGALFVQPQFAGGGAEAAAAAMGVELVELDPLAPDLAANLERMAVAIAGSLEGRR